MLLLISCVVQSLCECPRCNIRSPSAQTINMVAERRSIAWKGALARNKEVVGSRRTVDGEARGELGQAVVGVEGTPEEHGRGTLGYPRNGQFVER